MGLLDLSQFLLPIVLMFLVVMIQKYVEIPKKNNQTLITDYFERTN